MAKAYTQYQRHPNVPQSQPIPGREHEMRPNNAGGYTFNLDDWERLHRFLILGSEAGSYYVREKDLTRQNADCALRCIAKDGPRVVREARDVNVNNRAPKVDPQLFVLALCLKHGDEETRHLVESVAPDVLRTGMHVLTFAAMIDSIGGWSRLKRRVIATWFENSDINNVAFHALKYQQRNGWSQRDLLRVSHPAEMTIRHKAVYRWILSKDCEGVVEGAMLNLPDILVRYEHMMSMENSTPVAKGLWGVRNGLPREALPTEALADPDVNRELLPQMPLHQLLRNLAALTSQGVLIGDRELGLVERKLTNQTELRRARVHPFAVLLAYLVYNQGHSVQGERTWVPSARVIGALEDAYDLAFAEVEPTGKRVLQCIDVSGSMDQLCVGSPVSADTAAAAMAITMGRIEPAWTTVQFDTSVQRVVPITKRSSVAQVSTHSGGGTDLSCPITWALAQSEAFDAFVLLTDNETWAGRAHTSQVLDMYRARINPKAKLVCCSMSANHANIVDPTDPLSLGCAGLDANVPGIVTEFIASVDKGRSRVR